MNPVVELPAPAKLTLSLRITGVRDDGLHLIDAEMITLSLHDIVTIDPNGDGVNAIGRYAKGVPSDDRNIVKKALWLVERRAGVTIDKRIPHGGGLGGGSSDAAAVLRWAGFTDAPAAAVIGADVPFCLVGGRARVRGIGEIVEPLPHVDRRVTLVVPPLSVSTQAVYQAWDAMGGPTADGENDLEPAAIRVEPALANWRERIGNACGETPVLAGSGATWWVPGERVDALAALGDEGAEVIAARAIRAE
jgi:4-diphosphocytidyl-2-C-methyl-D-erythritol kinase